MPENFLHIALKYHEAGYRIIPVDAQKRPSVSSWSQYQAGQSKKDVEGIFSSDCEGIAMLMGNGIEAIDIDQKYDITGTLWNDYIKYVETFEDVLVMDLVVQSTVNGGFHLIYRCDEITGNTKLASRPATDQELTEYNEKVKEYNDKLKSDMAGGNRLNEVFRKEKTDKNSLPQVLFETRGEGGYILIEPSPGYKIDNGNIFDIPVISKESRRVLLNAAKSFNEVYKKEDLVNTLSKQKETKANHSSDITPLDDYKQRGDVVSLLKSHGWVEIGSRNERIYFRRPGKEFGNSADYHTGLKLFKTWSTNTELEEGKAYSPVDLFTTLEHGGDFGKAAKDLYSQGFGTRRESKAANQNGVPENLTDIVNEAKEEKDLFEKFLETRFDIHKPPKNVDVIFKIHSESESYDVGGLGMFGLIKGREKARKSTLGATILASAINGGNPLMNMELKIGDKIILHFDTEQSDFFYYQTQKRTLQFGGKNDNYPNFYSFSIKQYSINERIMLIDRSIDHFQNIGVLILDGLLDLCPNPNNEEKAMQTIQKVTDWRDKSGAMVLGVMHMSRGINSDTLGHLGAFANRKCDFSIEINLNKETDYSQVKPSLSRFKPFVGFEFTQDRNGVPKLNGSLMNILGNIESVNGYIGDEEKRQAEAASSNLISRAAKVNDDDIPF